VIVFDANVASELMKTEPPSGVFAGVGVELINPWSPG